MSPVARLLLVAIGVIGAAACQDDAATTEGGAGGCELGCGGSGATSSGGGETASSGGAGGAGGAGGEGGTPWTGVPLDTPLRLLFIGNSFTHQGPVPHLVRDLAASVGWPAPEVAYSAPGGVTLAYHRTLPETLTLVDAGGWDFVVVQDFSTRPTDNAGDPAAFKSDAAWFYDRIKQASPEAQVVLYETWARHPDHSVYPGTFADPAEMQAQLRAHYHDAASSYIPQNATFSPATDVFVAPVGDAWEWHLGTPEALVLHGDDLYHAGATGQYLNGLVLYSSIYGVVASGASPLGLSEQDVAALQAAADAATGISELPPEFPQPMFSIGQSVRLDLGAVPTSAPGWNVLADCVAGSSFGLVDVQGVTTSVDVRIVDAFTGANDLGLTNNTLGYPAEVSQDVCWTGSFDGHAQALGELGVVELEDVADGSYELVLFASRAGDDGGLGRLTRFTVGGESLDLDVSDNTSDVVTFTGVTPQDGTITVGVEASPAGAGRFGYLGALVLTKIGD